MKSLFLLFSCFIIVISALPSAVTLSDEKRLIKHLLENYEKVGIVGRPVYNISETVRVNFGLALIQMLDLDEKNQVLTTNVWHRFSWNDILLKWTPEDFGGVDHVRVPASAIWTPDIYPYNRVEDGVPYDKTLGSEMAVVSSDGSVMWVPHKIMKTTCAVDLWHFPWDTQQCRVKFGSWTYDGFKLDINFYGSLEEIDLTDYIPSNSWKILKATGRKNVKYYPCCEEPYPDLTFDIQMMRMPRGYLYTLVLPTVLLTLLIFPIFLLPPTMDSKLNLGIFVFFGNLFLLIGMSEGIPSKDSLTGLSVYLGFGLILDTVVILLSVLTVHLARKGKRGIPLPNFLKKVFNDCLGCILCVCSPGVCKIDGDEIKVDPKEENERDWETFATVLDRIFFVIMLIVVIAIGGSLANAR